MAQELLDRRWPEWGSAAIALLALVQPWLLSAWRRFFRRGKLEVYETGNIEVGFANFGPSVALSGTLRAVHQDVFVTAADAQVIRERDGATEHLTWRAFRATSVRLSESESVSLEPAASLLVQQASPFKFSIFFGSDAFVAEFSARAGKVPELWYDYTKQRIESLEPDVREQANAALAEGQAFTDALWRDFCSCNHISTLWRDLTTGFFWLPGRYRLRLTFNAREPARSVIREWSFSLSADDADQLRTNAIPLLRSLANLRAFFHFATPAYEESGALKGAS